MDDDEWSPDAEFEGMSVEQIEEQIYTNGPNWSPEQREAIKAWLVDHTAGGDVVNGQFGRAWLNMEALEEEMADGQQDDPLPYEPGSEDTFEQDVADAIAEGAGGGALDDLDFDVTEATNFDDAVEFAAGVFGRTSVGIRPDLTGLEEFIPDGLSPTDRQRFIDTATEQGRIDALGSEAQNIQAATGATEEEALAMAEQSIPTLDILAANEPDWLLRANGGMLSEQQKRRYVDYWNDAYGTRFMDFDELAPILARFDGTEREATEFAEAVLTAQEPFILHGIELPLIDERGQNRRATYTSEEMEQLRAMGFSNDAITRLVRLAGFQAGADGLRPGAAGDTLNVAPLAALVRYFGGGDEFARINEARQEQERLEGELGFGPGEWGRMSPEEREAFRDEVEQGARLIPGGLGGGTIPDPRRDTLRELEALLLEQGNIGGRTDPGIIGAQRGFNAGMDLYRGDQLLSFVHAIDPGLAERVASTGGDPDLLDWRDNAAVYDLLEQGGVIEGSNVRLRQLESATGFFGYFNTGRGAGAGGGGGAAEVRRMIDPEAVREQMQQLWSRMFLADVDDATVSAVTANLQQQLDDAPDGMNVDVSARIMSFLRAQDVYDELYRNKPEGMAEEEYQAQMAAGVSDMLGNELDPEALKAGMRTGDYQTAVGRAAASEKMLTNSTLRGRVASLKQLLQRNL